MCCRIALVLILLAAEFSRASDLDTIGVTLLRQVDSTLQGGGIKIAQAEAPTNSVAPYAFEVNPAAAGQPTNLFSWISSAGITYTTYPNAGGVESQHGDSVAANYYGIYNGVAPQVAHVYNYDANYLYDVIVHLNTLLIPAPVVNQSFVNPAPDANFIQDYDDYAAQRGTLFLSAIGNGGGVFAPGTSYNGIGVGGFSVDATNVTSSIGPASDGRSKPDLIAPGAATSFSTPLVSGAAAVLWQAGARGDGGGNFSAATNARTIKALLLNGAIKPAGWTNGPATPLDARYGAGVVNIFNSWKQLSGGKQTYIEATSPAGGGAHPPGANTNDIAALRGWDYNGITNSGTSDRVTHYYFKLPGGDNFTLTATLAWFRQNNQSNINNLNLYLYNAANSNLVAASTSAVDNVEHLFLSALAPGRYDLQVQKVRANQISTAENYALAFEFFTMPLAIAKTNSNVALTWPLAPMGFQLQSATNLTPAVNWQNVSAAIAINNNSNLVTLPASNAAAFFRLQR